MFNHLLGKVHRQKFVEDKYNRRPWPYDYLDLSQKELLKIAKKYAENSCNLSQRIRTRNSDEVFMESISPLKAYFQAYPAWPPGRAPWTIERCGSGCIPDTIFPISSSK